MSWFNPIKSLVKTSISLENETGVGKYNWMTVRYTFMVYIVSIFAGTVISYTPLNGKNPLNGFTLQIGDGDFTLMTFIMLVSPVICIGLLFYCYKIGLVDSSFKPKQ